MRPLLPHQQDDLAELFASIFGAIVVILACALGLWFMFGIARWAWSLA